MGGRVSKSNGERRNGGLSGRGRVEETGQTSGKVQVLIISGDR